jgi:glycosyltransferase involved in cell wall biosynthesis
MDFCLLIPYYNCFDDLVLSLQSIQYTRHKFSILIVDDGSDTPLTSAMLGSYLSSDIAIKVIRLDKNSGITKALNSGLSFLISENDFRFIARLDCGDICAPDRFYRQVNFFDKNPHIDLVGTWCIFKNHLTHEQYIYKTPTSQHAIEREMYFRNVFIHPTVMWRKSAIELYPEDFPHAEDYGLFYSQIKKINSAIIPEPLVVCKLNPAGISLANRKLQLKSRIAVVRALGKNKWLVLLGIVKVRLLIVLPYQLIFQLKKMSSVF